MSPIVTELSKSLRCLVDVVCKLNLDPNSLSTVLPAIVRAENVLSNFVAFQETSELDLILLSLNEVSTEETSNA